MGGRAESPPPPMLRDSEKPNLFRVNRALLIFLASRLGFLLSFYFVHTGSLLKSS